MKTEEKIINTLAYKISQSIKSANKIFRKFIFRLKCLNWCGKKNGK